MFFQPVILVPNLKMQESTNAEMPGFTHDVWESCQWKTPGPKVFNFFYLHFITFSEKDQSE